MDDSHAKVALYGAIVVSTIVRVGFIAAFVLLFAHMIPDSDRWESEHVLSALRFLKQRRIADGEYALILAERPAEHRSAKRFAFLRQTYESPTRQHLATRLKAILDMEET